MLRRALRRAVRRFSPLDSVHEDHVLQLSALGRTLLVRAHHVVLFLDRAVEDRLGGAEGDDGRRGRRLQRDPRGRGDRPDAPLRRAREGSGGRGEGGLLGTIF